ncbi:MAG: 23S rRNA pseudouridine synthase F [Flavobacteriales bacterium CG_4_9_14_3_um_filter_40_17]|nr:MAG: 23S rRNA pseudouridine synthase F [Flavobacteriales bacterium CG_4_9_14_3_um_filter_40_17]
MDDSLTRLNKFLSVSGFCSRRQADKLIEEKRITVNGKLPELGTKVSVADLVAVDGKPIAQQKKENIYLAFNKPVGIECTTNEKVKNNIISFINYPKRIFPIGRLDKNSEGLILLTDDGDIVNKISRAANFHEKEYLVTVNKMVTPDFIQKMSQGVPILNTVTRKCKVEKVNDYSFKIVLTQGLNRQIRRMCEYFDYEVIKLRRIRIMNILLDVPLGKYRLLREEEIELLNR